MPYLHWETDEARDKMALVIKDILSPPTQEQLENKTLSGVKFDHLKLSKGGKNIHLGALVRAKHQLLEGADSDERLLRVHLISERPVHIRRTLDQSYYWTLKDTSLRDRDQVVYRATNQPNQVPRIPRVVMVDQLWMWILDGSSLPTLSLYNV